MAEKLIVDFDLKKYPNAGSASYQAENENILGSGAYAEVWAVRSQDGQMLRAVKLTAPSDRGKLVEEYQRLEQLKRLDDDDLIVRAFGLGQARDGRPCMLMELVEGQPLWKLGQELRGRLQGKNANWYAEDEILRVRVAAQIAKALYTAYKAQIALIDLKMDNIFYNPSWPQLVKVVDWNLVFTSDIPNELSNKFIAETLPKIGRMMYEMFTGLEVERADQIGEMRADQTWGMFWDMLTVPTRVLLRDTLSGNIAQDNPSLALWSRWTAHRRLLYEKEGLELLRGVERGDFVQTSDTTTRPVSQLVAYSVLNLIEPNEQRATRLREAWHSWIENLLTQKEFSQALIELRTARRLYSNSLRLEFWFLFSLLGQYAPSRHAYADNIQTQRALVNTYWDEGKFKKLSSLLVRVRERVEELWYPDLVNKKDDITRILIEQVIKRLETILKMFTLLVEQGEKIRINSTEAVADGAKLEIMLQDNSWLGAYLDDEVKFKPPLRELWKRQPLYREIHFYSLAEIELLPELIRLYDTLASQEHLDQNFSVILKADVEKLKAALIASFPETNQILLNLKERAEVIQLEIHREHSTFQYLRQELFNLQRIQEDIHERATSLQKSFEYHLRLKVDSLNEANHFAENQIVEITSTTNEQLKKLADLVTDIEKKLHDIEDQRNELLIKVNENQERVGKYSNLLTSLLQNNAQLEIHLTELEEKGGVIGQRSIDLNRMLADHEQERLRLSQSSENLDQQYKELEDGHLNLSSRSVATKEALTSLSVVLTVLDAQRQDLNHQIEILGNQYQEMENRRSGLRKAYEAIPSSMADLDAAASEIDLSLRKLEQVRKELDLRLSDLAKDINKIEDKYKIIEGQSTNLEKNTSSLEQSRQLLQGYLAEISTAYAAMRQASDELLMKAEGLKNRLLQASKDRQNAQELLTKLSGDFDELEPVIPEIEKRAASVLERTVIIDEQQKQVSGRVAELEGISNDLQNRTNRIQKDQTNLEDKLKSLEATRRELIHRQRTERRLMAITNRNTRPTSKMLLNKQNDPEFEELLIDIAHKIPQGIFNTQTYGNLRSEIQALREKHDGFYDDTNRDLTKLDQRINYQKIAIVIVGAVLGFLIIFLVIGLAFFVIREFPDVFGRFAMLSRTPDTATATWTAVAIFAQAPTVILTETALPTQRPTLTMTSPAPTLTPTIASKTPLTEATLPANSTAIALPPISSGIVDILNDVPLTLDGVDNKGNAVLVKDLSDATGRKALQVGPGDRVEAVGKNSAKDLILIKTDQGQLGWIKRIYIGDVQLDVLPEVVTCYGYEEFSASIELPDFTSGTPATFQGNRRVLYQALAVSEDEPIYIQLNLGNDVTGWVRKSDFAGGVCVGDLDSLPKHAP